MPFVAQDIVNVNLRQEYLEQDIVNTLFYRIAEIVAGAVVQAIWDKLIDTLLDIIEVGQSDLLTHYEQTIDNLTDGTSQAVVNDIRTGILIAGEALSSFYAIGLKKTVGSRVTRPGSIRIAGIMESSVQNNSLTAGAFVSYSLLGAGLGNTHIIDDGVGDIVTFEPVVVGRTPLGGFDLARVNPVTDFITPRVTTQNSRKVSL